MDVSIYYLPKDDANRYKQSTASEVIGILEVRCCHATAKINK